MSGVGQPRTQPERRHHRQSKRQERGKRGAWIDPHGYDAGKKIKGKKRHILVDTQGLLLHALVHSAYIQDRDGGVLVMATLFGLHPFLLKLYADGGYQGPIFQSAVRKILRQIDVEIVKRSGLSVEALPILGQVPSEMRLEFVWRILREHEGIVSGGKVNRLIDGLCGERLPTIHLAHVDLS